jgi:hypothetical protein
VIRSCERGGQRCAPDAPWARPLSSASIREQIAGVCGDGSSKVADAAALTGSISGG